MNDFTTGFLLGSLIIGLVTSPFLTYFGVIYFNFRRMDKKLSTPIPTPVVELDDETTELLKKANEILSQTTQ